MVVVDNRAGDEPQAGRLAGLLFQARRGVPRRYSRGADGDRGTHRSVSRAGHAAPRRLFRLESRELEGPVYGGAPTNRWLGLYAEMFDAVEVNSSFYRHRR